MTQIQNKPSGYFPESFYFYTFLHIQLNLLDGFAQNLKDGCIPIPHSQILLQESLLYVENPLL